MSGVYDVKYSVQSHIHKKKIATYKMLFDNLQLNKTCNARVTLRRVGSTIVAAEKE